MTSGRSQERDERPAKRAKPAAKKASEIPQPRHSPEDISMAKIVHRHQLLMAVVDRGGKIGMILAFGFLLWLMQPMVYALAGKTTEINAVMTASLVTNLALAGGNVVQYTRRRSQGSEIRRQRQRSDRLEAQLEQQSAEAMTESER
jgi:heme exporter protein D